MPVFCLQGLRRCSFVPAAQNVVFKKQQAQCRISFRQKCSCFLVESNLCDASKHRFVFRGKKTRDAKKTSLSCTFKHVQREQDAVTHSNTLGNLINSNKQALCPVTIYHLSHGCTVGERKEKMDFGGNTQSPLSPTDWNNNHEILIRLQMSSTSSRPHENCTYTFNSFNLSFMQTVAATWTQLPITI